MGKSDRRIFVFGWDAATWPIIERLRGEGRLRNLDRMIRDGVSATLVAEEPILSPSVWTTIASGKGKARHGILDFNVSARHVRCKRIWDILQEKGLTTGTYGHFVTWPPREVNGFIVPGLLAATDETYPPELSFLRTAFDPKRAQGGSTIFGYAANALRALRYGLNARNLLQIFWFLVIRTFRKKENLAISLRRGSLGSEFQFNFFMKLFGKYRPHYSFFHAHIIDGASHRCWRYLEPERFPGTREEDVKRYGDAIFRAYELLDKLLGKFMKRFGDGITCAVISDHGIGAGEGRVLSTMYKVKIQRLMELAGASDEYRAVDRGFEVVYLRRKVSDREKVSKHAGILAEIRFEKSAKPLFQVDLEGESIFLIDRFDKEKVAEQMEDMILIGGRKYPLGEIVREHELQTSGWHHPEGVFVISGEGIAKGRNIGRIQQPDITPTLLHLYGLPAGKDMDGKILKEAFDEEFIKANPPKYIDTYEKPGDIKAETESMELPDEVERKLRDLGYFS